MTQLVEFPGFSGNTINARFLAIGTTSIAHTSTGITGKTNDPTQFVATTVPNSLQGFYRISAIDQATTTTDVIFAGYVKLTGVDSARHYAETYMGALNVWSVNGRALSDPTTGPAINWRRGESNTKSLTGLGDLSGWTKLYFTAKAGKDAADSASAVKLVRTTTGGTSVERIAGGTGTTGDVGTITVDDAINGNVTITLNPNASAKLPRLSKGFWDFQKKNGSGGISTLRQGSFLPTMDITRATT